MSLLGAPLLGISADEHKDEYKELMAQLAKPNVSARESEYFTDLENYFPRASKLSAQARSEEMTQNLALREQALPGSTQALRDSMNSIAPLLRGELPQSVMDNFVRAGGASSVGSGFGGSGFGFLNTGLFGARGSLGAIQTGMGLLPSLLSSIPHVSAPTTFGLLSNLMTPQERVNLDMQLRQQQIGINTQIATMPTANDVWGAALAQTGSQAMGIAGGMLGMGGGGGGGGGGLNGFMPNYSTGGFSSGYGGYSSLPSAGGYRNWGPAGGWDSGSGMSGLA